MAYNTNNTNSLANTTAPAWIPSGFRVTAHSMTSCPSTSKILSHFAIYNAVAIAIFIVKGSSLVRSKATCGAIKPLEPWTFWSGLRSVAVQIGGMVITAYLIQLSGYDVQIWSLMQLWAVRPRAIWLVGNATRLSIRLGYMSSALDSVMTEIFVCGLSLVFVGRLVQAVITHPLDWRNEEQNQTMHNYHYIAFAAGIAMIILTSLEVLWAAWQLKRLLETRGKAEAQDMDSLKYITGGVVPLTCLSSCLIWYAFLSTTKGIYCPGNINLVDVVWIVVPVVTNMLRGLVDAWRPN